WGLALGSMGEHVSNGHIVPDAAVDDPLWRRQVVDYGLVQLQPARFIQLHQQGRGECLGKRSDAKRSSRCDRWLPRPIRQAQSHTRIELSVWYDRGGEPRHAILRTQLFELALEVGLRSEAEGTESPKQGPAGHQVTLRCPTSWRHARLWSRADLRARQYAPR